MKKSVFNNYIFFIHCFKVHLFWESHKISRNLPLTFDCMYCSQKWGEDFAKLCGLLRIYELYHSVECWSECFLFSLRNFILQSSITIKKMWMAKDFGKSIFGTSFVFLTKLPIILQFYVTKIASCISCMVNINLSFEAICTVYSNLETTVGK